MEFLISTYHWQLAFNGIKGWLLVLLIVIACLALFFSWQSLRNVTSRAKWSMMFSLRTIGIILIVLVALQAGVELEKFVELRDKLVLVFDNSMSMTMKSSGGGEHDNDRADKVLEFINENKGYINRLEKDFDVQYLLFSNDVRLASRQEIENGWSNDGIVTDFESMFKYLKEHYSESDTRAFLLFSDGGDNVDKSVSASAKLERVNMLAGQLAVPIYSFVPVDSTLLQDIAITGVEYDEYAFVRNESKIKVLVKVDGFGGHSIPVTLKEGEKLISSKLVSVVPGKSEYVVDFQVTPNKVGSQVYSLSVPVFGDEQVKQNNSTEFALSIVRDKIRVLHLSGRPSWDVRFFRRVLKQVHNIDLVSFYILKTSNDISEVSNSEMSLIPFPIEKLFVDILDSFDLVVFQNFDYRPFDMPAKVFEKYFNNLKLYVQNAGGAFLMIGGDLSFSNGGYHESAVKDILPVKMNIGGPQLDFKSFKTVLTSAGQQHPVGLLDNNVANNMKIWGDLPELDGCNAAVSTKSGSVTIAENPSFKVNGMNIPVIAAGNFGNGRSMAIMTDTLWKWDFISTAKGGTNRYYLRFWNNAIKWLTHDPGMNSVKVDSDKTDYNLDELVKIGIRALDSGYQPVVNGKVGVDIIKSINGDVVLSTSVQTDDKGECSLVFQPEESGYYRTVIKTVNKNRFAGENHSIFNVKPVNMEFNDTGINEKLLAGISNNSGGKLFRLPLQNSINDELSLESSNRLKPSGKENYTLWDNWVTFIVISGVFGVDWWLRFKEGLS